MIVLHVPFTRMSFLKIKDLLLKGHTFPLTMLYKEGMSTKPGKNFCIEFQWNTSWFTAELWTLSNDVMFTNAGTSSYWVTCQLLSKYRQVFSTSDTFMMKSPRCSKQGEQKPTKIFLLAREERKKSIRIRPFYSVLLILVRKKRVQSHAWVINNCCFWPRVKQTICLHCSHCRLHE